MPDEASNYQHLSSKRDDDFLALLPDTTINRTHSAWSVTDNSVLPESLKFSRSNILQHLGYSLSQSVESLNHPQMSTQEQILKEPDSTSLSFVTSPQFDDRRYRFLRTYTPTPYRSPFNTSTISLPEIKEVTNEDNDTSSTTSSKSSLQAHKIGQQSTGISKSSIDMKTQHDVAENSSTAHQQKSNAPQLNFVIDQPLVSWVRAHAENIASSTQEAQRYNLKSQKPAASIVTVKITDPRSSQKMRSANVNQTYRKDISEEANYVFQDALESPRSYSSDSSKQPKSILKQPSVPLFSSSVHSEGDDTLERRVERVHINENENSEEWILKNRNQNQPKNFSRPTGLGTHFTSESQKYYDEIPKNMKQHSETPTHLPQASFNGPFFTLEEVQTRHKRAEISDEYHMISGNQRLEDNPPTTQNIRQISSEKESKNHQQKHSNRSKSVSIIEMNAEESEKNNEIKENILHWSTQTLKGQRERARSVPPSLKTRNIMDPDQIDEYRRQKKLELEAMRRREEETMFWRQKQARFLKMQEQLFYEQFHADKKEISANFNDSHEELRLIDINAQRRQQQQYAQESIEPQFIRVYETRPIMAVSEVSGSGRLVSTPNQVTWKRMYIVDSPKPVAKNEIITSEQLLEKERFDIDLLKRREAFIEKPKIEPTIFRTGKRWKPPAEQPFIWPNMRILANSEKVIESSSNYSTDSAPARTVEGAEFRWQPFVYDPEYKREHKNFIVEDSPPSTPRGFGPGSLDEPAKRQIKHLIQPLPDGSHRPKPAFGGPRATPSGGFHPHAPNAVKVLRKKLSHSTSSLETGDVDADKEVEIIHQRRFHRLGDQSPIITTSGSDIAEWEKIYDLPPHSSTITPRDTPQNVNVRGKLAAFEHALRQSTPFMQHRINVSEPHRRPTSSMRTLNIESNLHSPKNAQFARNDQYLRQKASKQQQSETVLLSPTSTRTETSESVTPSRQHRRYERQASSSNGFLLRRIDQREKVRPMISANNYQQEQSRRKALPQDYTNINNTAQQHNIIQSAPSVHHRQIGPRVFPARRLKRIPLEFSNNRRDHSIIVTEAQPSRIIRTNHQR